MTQLWRAFGDLVPLFLIMVFIGSFGFLIFYRRNSRHVDLRRLIINFLWIMTVIGILFVTVFPTRFGAQMPRVVNLIPLVETYNILFNSVNMMVPIRELGFNILLFIPFGLFLGMSKPINKARVAKITFLGFLLSISIEVVQYIVPMGRVADIDDLILNTLGAFLGCIIWVFTQKTFLKPQGKIRKQHP